ncbi:hypothetical protein ACFQFC_10100 [Amorphoplanes digitatis]|uniref:Uncharacterized protein n=1 Tax=Actinoplanes digitatis TaxID=1868 RepID=A0A7W7I136_9ACTN|nr:hypothetical protein [Actinoplanes digitatis]MBB4764549.1 hypothetical protein [Actinoplanes digitatis]BFE74034.1 hypothetical protein GCM10020092_073350 [Actinoplanes digitatis]
MTHRGPAADRRPAAAGGTPPTRTIFTATRAAAAEAPAVIAVQSALREAAAIAHDRTDIEAVAS